MSGMKVALLVLSIIFLALAVFDVIISLFLFLAYVGTAALIVPLIKDEEHCSWGEAFLMFNGLLLLTLAVVGPVVIAGYYLDSQNVARGTDPEGPDVYITRDGPTVGVKTGPVVWGPRGPEIGVGG